LRTTLDHLQRHPQVGLLLRGYAWFRRSPQQPEGTVRYVSEPLLLAPGEDAIAMCFRRSGVISGYIIARDPAHAAATTQFDGTLYYQMHLTAAVLASRPALVVPEVLVLCRDEIPPDFGAASSEYGRFVPGRYTPQARVHMLRGAMQILLAHTAADTAAARRLRTLVARDYARHFYPFVMDQLALPFRDYLAMCRQMANTPVGRHPSFYVNCAIAYALGRRRCDAWLRAIRDLLGRTPRF
jgi:hypothetical protein